MYFFWLQNKSTTVNKSSQGIYSWHFTLQLPILLLRTFVYPNITFNRLKLFKNLCSVTVFSLVTIYFQNILANNSLLFP